MTWEWSHTNEEYNNAYENLSNMERNKLEEIYAEWHAWNKDTVVPQIDCDHFDRIMEGQKKVPIPEDILIDFIWEKASGWDTGRNCDNGGFNAYMCPFGCGCHTVPFDRKEEITAWERLQ